MVMQKVIGLFGLPMGPLILNIGFAQVKGIQALPDSLSHCFLRRSLQVIQFLFPSLP